MLGLMQDRPLLISSLIEHAAAIHPRRRDRLAHASKARSIAARIATSIAASKQARQRARRPRRRSPATASPRWRGTATGTWSSTTACRAWARCCTRSIRAFPRAARLHRQPCRGPVLFFDLTLRCRWSRQLRAALLESSSASSLMTDRAHMPAVSAMPNLLCYEELHRRERDDLRLAEFDENTAVVAVLHVGHDRQPEGRAVSAIARRCCTPTPPALPDAWRCRRRETRAARRADVPRQRLGHAVRRRAWSAPSWCCPARRDGASVYELFESERVTLAARRAHGLADAAAATLKRHGLKPRTTWRCTRRDRRLRGAAGDDRAFERRFRRRSSCTAGA